MANIFNVIFDYMQELFSTLIGDIIVALIILLLGIAIGKIIQRIIFKFLKNLEIDKTLKSTAGIKFSLESFISNGILYLVYFIASIMALSKLGITTTVLQVLLILVMVLIAISTFLAVKDFIPNSVAGFIIYRSGLFKIGDIIKVNDIEGKVLEISILETQLKKSNGDIIHIPNSTMNKSKIIVKKK